MLIYWTNCNGSPNTKIHYIQYTNLDEYVIITVILIMLRMLS